MALSTGGFAVNKLTVSQILQLLPEQPQLLKESFFTQQEYGHPLGIGWNKVEFHRNFCSYAGLITEAKAQGEYRLTDLGEILVRYDLNLAKVETWWIIHTNLSLDRDTNVYYELFARFPQYLLNKDEIIHDMVSALSPGVAESTVRKDTASILGWFEQPPFANLGTLVTDGTVWARRMPAQPLSPYVAGYAAAKLQQITNNKARSTRLSDLLKGRGSLGTVFNLRDEDLKSWLRQAATLLSGKFFSISETAGMDTIYFGNGQNWEIAEQFYLSQQKQPSLVT